MEDKWIAVDFDGVISTYDGWKEFDVFGEPIPEVIEAMRKLKKLGYKITIFTTRCFTPSIEKWLNDNNVPYDTFNSTAHNDKYHANRMKPIWDAYIGDRSINFNMANNKLTSNEIVENVTKVINQYKDNLGD